MEIVGLNYSTNTKGNKVTTIQVLDDYNAYYNNPEGGRGCIGKKADSVYVGEYDCSELKVGMHIDVLYDKAVTTAKGSFQPIKKIEVLK